MNGRFYIQVWKEFEIRHGNEDTMREMLRIKRSVQATYNTQVNMLSAQMLAAAGNAEAAAAPVVQDSMKLLDSKAGQLAQETVSSPPPHSPKT